MPDRLRVMTQTKRDTPLDWGFGVGLATPPHKKVLLGNFNWRPRPTQGCGADDDDDDYDDDLS
jgi:hypothetical protein